VIIKGRLCLVPCLVLGPNIDFGIGGLVVGNGEVAVVNSLFSLILVRVAGEEKLIDEHTARSRIRRSLIDGKAHSAHIHVVHAADRAEGWGNRVHHALVLEDGKISRSSP